MSNTADVGVTEVDEVEVGTVGARITGVVSGVQGSGVVLRRGCRSRLERRVRTRVKGDSEGAETRLAATTEVVKLGSVGIDAGVRVNNMSTGGAGRNRRPVIDSDPVPRRIIEGEGGGEKEKAEGERPQ
jgi:hypothetical protein